MLKILLAVDGSENSARAVAHLIRVAARYREPLEVQLLNVQAPVASGLVRRFLSDAALDGYYRDEAQVALGPAEAALRAAGIPVQAHVAVGQVAETITDYARQHDCEEIVLGNRGLGGVRNALLGSVASQVLHLADRPVLLVK